ncbi:Gfo/Idh/MocA family oxidoreductase [Candidatus Thorarchaeota archaeon]|nr:MAG: Gfo/Idh/MocA family oxidoreductase [Candidatus Thorarchaeota archaeon]
MSKDEVGVVVIGLGFVGGRAHAPSFARIEGSNVVAVSDIVPEAADRLVKKYECKYYRDYKEALDDPDIDAAVVSTPTPYHYEIASEALSRGKHVLCEMPLTSSIELSERLAKEADESGLILLPVLNFRFTPNYVKAKEILREGALGTPMAFTFREHIPAKELAMQWPLSSWAWDAKKSGGLPDYTLSVWSIDLLRWLFETEIESVRWQSSYNELQGVDNFKGYQTVGVVKLENGAVGTLQYGATVGEGLGTSRLEVYGSNTKTLEAIWNNSVKIMETSESIDEWTFAEKGPRVWGHRQTDEYFVECILDEIAPSFGPKDAIIAQRVSRNIVK